jgi:hypothetical protein
MFHGSHGPFRWVESPAHKTQDVLQLCPEAVLGKHLVITAFDSTKITTVEQGPLRAWRVEGSALYVRPPADLLDIPYDVFNEWFVFTAAPAQQKLESFMSSNWFTLGPCLSGNADRATQWEIKRTQRAFWQLLESASPESYLACGNRLIFVTRNDTFFTAVLRRISAPQRARSASA